MKKETIEEKNVKKVDAKQYQKAVRAALQYVNRYDEVRFKIVEICLSVCEVTLGGKKTKTIYTMQKFADDIGINYRTLNNWSRVKKCVVDKLPVKLLKDSKYSYTDLEDVINAIGYNETATRGQVKQAFLDQLAVPVEQKKFTKYSEVLDAILYNLQRPLKAGVAERTILETIKKKCQTCVNLIETELSLREKFSLEERVNTQLKERKIALDNVAETMMGK